MRSEAQTVSIVEKPIELRLLGPFELVDAASGSVISISSARIRALMAHLAVAPRYTATRRTLAGLLWAGKEDGLARQSLRQLLSQFRNGADPRVAGLINGDETSLSLDRSLLVIDRTTLFDMPVDAGIASLIGVAALYRSDFAAGLDIGETEFDDWLRNERLNCRERAIRLLDRLVRVLAEADRHDEALIYANRLTELDPLREETHRLVIAEEAVVSGRASAMARFEQFRLLLREELGVRPEVATLQLLESLRRTRDIASAPDTSETPPSSPSDKVIRMNAVSPAWTRSWKPVALAAGLGAILVGAAIAVHATNLIGGLLPIAQSHVAVQERVNVAFAPFNPDKSAEAMRQDLRPFEDAAKDSLAQNPRLSLVSVPAPQTLDQDLRGAQTNGATYLLETDITQNDDGPIATAILYEAATSTRIFVSRIQMSGDSANFGRSFLDKMYPAILLDYTRMLSSQAPNSVTTLLWQAVRDAAVNGNRAIDPPEFAKFEAVLAKDPNNIEAIVGLARGLVERAARDQSTGLNRIDDISRAARLIQQAQRLETPKSPPVLSRIAYIAGLINKVESRFTEARADFKSAVAFDPASAEAAAQAAHVNLFLGHIAEAYAEMKAIPNLDYLESAFVAAETALMAGHPDEARFYYDRAVSTTPDIPRNYAWRAIALWRLHRQTEAHQNALTSQEMKPAYRAYWISNRTALGDRRYRDARDLCAKDFAEALAFEPGEQNAIQQTRIEPDLIIPRHSN